MGRFHSLPCAGLLLVLALLTGSSAAGRQLKGVPAPADDPADLPATDGPAAASPVSAVDVSADIYRGLPAPAGMFDFAVRVKATMQDENGQLYNATFCSGALISPDTVLTAAHCLEMKDGTMVPASLLILEVQGVPYFAASTFVHPSYSPGALGALNADLTDGRPDNPLVPKYDIAAIKLTSPVANATVIQLAAADLALEPGAVLEVAGWGLTGSDENLPTSDTLLYTSLAYAAPYDPNNVGAPGTCPRASFTDTICAVGIDSSNSCQGDSGGPLVIRDYSTGVATLLGVVSYGPPCDLAAYGWYTDVRQYLTDIAALVSTPAWLSSSAASA